MTQSELTLRPIGSIETPWRTIEECPRNGRQPDPAPQCRVRIFEPFVPGLLGLEGISHLILLYWLNQTKPRGLVFTPPFASEQKGLFATRAPWRPNPIGLSVVRFDGFEGPDQLLVRFLDCLDGTPLLDIKPYLPTTDSEQEATMGWLAPHATRNANTVVGSD